MTLIAVATGISGLLYVTAVLLAAVAPPQRRPRANAHRSHDVEVRTEGSPH